MQVIIPPVMMSTGMVLLDQLNSVHGGRASSHIYLSNKRSASEESPSDEDLHEPLTPKSYLLPWRVDDKDRQLTVEK